MESICNLNDADGFRLCSSVLDAMSTQRIPNITFSHLNYLVKARHHCVQRIINVNPKVKTTMSMLRCSIIHENEISTPFHVAADVREQGAVFVFAEDGHENMVVLKNRLIKIGVLLHPSVGSASVTLQKHPCEIVEKERKKSRDKAPAEVEDENRSKSRKKLSKKKSMTDSEDSRIREVPGGKKNKRGSSKRLPDTRRISDGDKGSNRNKVRKMKKLSDI